MKRRRNGDSVYESDGTEHDDKDETGDDGEDEDENEEDEDDDADEENEDERHILAVHSPMSSQVQVLYISPLWTDDLMIWMHHQSHDGNLNFYQVMPLG